jgi:hypothetical protein
LLLRLRLRLSLLARLLSFRSEAEESAVATVRPDTTQTPVILSAVEGGRPPAFCFLQLVHQTPHPSIPPPKNKVQKRGVFFAPKKVPSKPPRLPRKPPQMDHKLPSKITPKTQKTPIKSHSTTPNFFPKKHSIKIPTPSG